ncbi:MAG: hypothetical protein PWP23_1064 [Candidatus Sumerlaeota bacterium]|nr:hypothetical protein [Candidatus Sumerlaeota bacterium]
MADEKKWNLGKEVPQPKKPEPKKPEPKPVVAARVAPPKPAPLPEEESYSSSMSSETVLGRPVPPPKSVREYLNHPLALIGSGLLICLAIFFLVARGMGGGRTSGRAVTLEPADAVRGLLGDKGVQQDVLSVDFESTEPPQVQDARLILATGQTLDAIASYRETQARDPQKGTDEYLFVPPAIAEAPLPEGGTEDDRALAELIREEARYQAFDIGRRALEQAMTLNLTAAELRGYATRLTTEGLALVEASGDAKSLERLPAAKGAENRLSIIESAQSAEDIENLVRGLFDPGYAQAVLEARQRHFAAGSAAKGQAP